MKIPTTVFYQPLITQSLFSSVAENSDGDTIAVQKEVLSYLDVLVSHTICEHLPDLETQKQFLERAQITEKQEELLSWLAAQDETILAILQERIDRALLELHTALQ